MPWPKLPPLDQGGTILSGVSDEADALAKSLPEFLVKVYRYAKALVGEDEANKLFLDTVPKKTVGEHGPWQNLMPNRDAFLLREYDLWSKGLTAREIGRLPRILGDLFHRAAPRKLGATADAITHRIRELVRERKIRRAQQQPSKAARTLLSRPTAGGN
jgi:hypothetical protein